MPKWREACIPQKPPTLVSWLPCSAQRLLHPLLHQHHGCSVGGGPHSVLEATELWVLADHLRLLTPPTVDREPAPLLPDGAAGAAGAAAAATEGAPTCGFTPTSAAMLSPVRRKTMLSPSLSQSSTASLLPLGLQRYPCYSKTWAAFAARGSVLGQPASLAFSAC